MKNVYKGIFSFNNGIVREYARAVSFKQARLMMAQRIAKKQEVDQWTVLKWMNQNPLRCKITLEMEVNRHV